MNGFAYWSMPGEEALRRLDSSADGLSGLAAARALRRAGPNSLRVRRKRGPFRLFLDQLKSPIVLILLFATVVSAFLRDWGDSLIILTILLGSALLGFFQEYRADIAAEKLKEGVSFKSRVMRDGKIESVPTEELVPGDVVILSAGSLVPADGIVLEARDLFVNQAVLTGETFPVEKRPGPTAESAGLSQRTNVVFMGTTVRSGSARVLVAATGLDTAFGGIAEKLSLRPPETEFQRGVRRLGFLLTEVMLLLVMGIFFFNVFFHKPVLDSLLFSVALAVGLTPQLLPAIININLSRGSQDMARKGVIVRRLESMENFGSMDILCTDKTGTLTMGAVRLDGALDARGEPSDRVALYAGLNAAFQTGPANPLDEAILRGTPGSAGAFEKTGEIPYDFVRKRLTVAVRDSGSVFLITKGALENVLAVCSQVDGGGEKKDLHGAARAEILERFRTWSSRGYRVLGLAVGSPSRPDSISMADEKDMTFSGFLLFFDPPKEDAPAAVASLAGLGVRLKMITGDNRLAAEHIGGLVGLGETKALTGGELDSLRDEALWHAVEETAIFAEVDPNQKERIILALKKRGHVVGYMGDGINDAPSLHSADVGISVANAVDAAKAAADLVLLRQDLSVLRDGIVLGRTTFANTLKYVFMAVGANFGNMFSMAGASLFLPFLPMRPKQILLINFLTDLPEMTIAGDSVDEGYIMRPRRLDIGFIRRFMLVFGPLSSLFDFATFGALLWFLKAGEAVFQTGWFVESVLSACLVVFAVRTRLPFQRSRPRIWMPLVSAAVMSAALYLPYSPLGELFGFVPLPVPALAGILGVTAAYFISAEAVKRLFYRWAKNRD